jgi:hypothetical protein
MLWRLLMDQAHELQPFTTPVLRLTHRDRGAVQGVPLNDWPRD